MWESFEGELYDLVMDQMESSVDEFYVSRVPRDAKFPYLTAVDFGESTGWNFLGSPHSGHEVTLRIFVHCDEPSGGVAEVRKILSALVDVFDRQDLEMSGFTVSSSRVLKVMKPYYDVTEGNLIIWDSFIDVKILLGEENE